MTRENVLLLLTDQERYDVSAPGGPPVETPSLDRLAATGRRFTRAYTPTGICSSARASLLTGVYPHTHGMVNNCHGPDAVVENLPRDHVTFGEVLAGAGYDVSYAGKWHVGREDGPADFGFDPVVEMGPAVDDDGFERYLRERGYDPGGETLSDELYTEYDGYPDTLVAATTDRPPAATRTYFLAERTIDRLDALADGDAPFFHRTDFPGPHHPYVVPEPYASMYDPDDVEPWANFAETFDGKPAVQEAFVRYRGVDGFDWDRWARAVAHYFGFVSFIDDQVGRILDAVERLGLTDETVVVHAADHGDFTGSHRQFNKGPLMYDEVYRIPLLVRWPGVTTPGSTCDAPASLLDLMPTFLDVAGESPPDVAGRSLRPLCAGDPPADWRDVVVSEYHGDEFGLYTQRMVRGERFKYVYNAFGRDELYDVEADPAELSNLVAHPEHRATLSRLRRRLCAWMRETDDPVADWTCRVLDPGPGTGE